MTPGTSVEVIADVLDFAFRSQRGRTGVVLDRRSPVPHRPVVVCLDGCWQRDMGAHDRWCRNAGTYSPDEIKAVQDV